MNIKRSFFNKKDIIIVSIILLLALIVYFTAARRDGALICEVSLIGGESKSMIIDLDLNGVFIVFGMDSVRLEVKNRAIAFIESDCPDKICVHTGFISSNGEIAVCLPNRLAVRIYSDKAQPGAPDTISR